MGTFSYKGHVKSVTDDKTNVFTSNAGLVIAFNALEKCVQNGTLMIELEIENIYIIINVLSRRSRIPLHGIGRAIARWNRLGSHMNTSWEMFASRAPYARSTQNCVFFTT